jgi:S1-C subfamily serine protease
LNFFADLVEKVAPAVVYVQVSTVAHSFRGVQVAASGGSGLIVRADGLVLTNAHVVGSFRNSELTVSGFYSSRYNSNLLLQITLNDGRKFNGRVVKLDRRTDLAIVKIDGAVRNSAQLGSNIENTATRARRFCSALQHINR